MRRFLIVMNILLIIMASLFVQCKPENGNGDSTDEEVAFPALEEEEAPAADTACQLIERLFRNLEEARKKLQKGKKLFSRDNGLNFFLIVKDDLARGLEGQQKLHSNGISLMPEVTISTDKQYHLFKFSLQRLFKPSVGGGSILVQATVACRVNQCHSLHQSLSQIRDFNCLKNYYFRLNKQNIEFGKATGDEPLTFQALQPIAILKSLIQSTETVHETWTAEIPSYDNRSTVMIREEGSEKAPFKLKLFCSSLLHKRSRCVLPKPERDFIRGLIIVLRLHAFPIELDEKPIRKKTRLGRFWTATKNFLGGDGQVRSQVTLYPGSPPFG